MSKSAEKMARRIYEEARAKHPLLLPPFDKTNPTLRRWWIKAVGIYMRRKVK